jgi:large subunit ribosomal protein L44e
MKRPRKIRSYCPFCKKHQVIDIERGKKRKASELKQGQRRFRRVTAGYRGFPRAKPEGREKPTRRVYLKYVCTVCTRGPAFAPRSSR